MVEPPDGGPHEHSSNNPGLIMKRTLLIAVTVDVAVIVKWLAVAAVVITVHGR